MPTTAPTPAGERDWDRIDAGHSAVDALNNIIGEVRGLLAHDPDALPQLQASLGVILGPDQPPTSGAPIVIRQDHRRTLTVELVGDSIAVIDRWSDETGEPHPLRLAIGSASDLPGALLITTHMVRTAPPTD